MSNSGPKPETLALFQGIQEDARLEAERLRREAEKGIQNRKAAAEQQAERILSEAHQRVQDQIEIIRKNTASAIAVETRRQTLRARDQVVRHTLEVVRKEIKQIVDSPEYRDILLGWIVEAVLGLDAVELRVNASLEELSLLDVSLLGEAEQQIETLTGRKVHLEKTREDPLLSQGVVVTEQEGRIAFNNQVQTRLLRYQSEISRMIHEALFQEEES
jgi:vacuolar-type H+-ATPase subunit E/Vma4